jgi:hypothetical protein
LKNGNFAEFLKGKIAMAHKTGNYADLVENHEECLYLKDKQTQLEIVLLSFEKYKKSREPFNHFEVS